MSKILVGSVFSGTVPPSLNVRWYDLQLRFLEKTTLGHQVDHIVALSQGQGSPPFTRSRVVYQEPERTRPTSLNHARNLHRLVDMFKEQRKDYDYFLLLDSDAFPCRNDWLAHLLKLMGDHSMACVARFENLTWFPHPCACFLKPDGLDNLDWMPASATAIDGHNMHDPGVAMKDAPFYPLVRTNKRNVHPLLCGIYGRIFYHHGAGSRPSRAFRSAQYYGVPDLSDRWRKELFDTPVAFLRKLDW